MKTETDALLKDRVTAQMEISTRMVEGDLWLDGKGLAIQMPTGDAAKKQEIEDGFATQNVLDEICKTRRDGILGREPRASLVAGDGGDLTAERQKAVDEMWGAINEWWNNRGMLDVLKSAVTLAFTERRACLRPFASTKAFNGNTLRTDFKDFNAALDNLHFEIQSASVAGVFAEAGTLDKFSVYKFEKDGDETLEFSMKGADGFTYLEQIKKSDAGSGANWLDENGLTQLAEYAKRSIVRRAGDETISYQPLNLRGHLYLFEMDLNEPFVTEAMKSLQKLISLAETMDGRNLYAGGIRKTHYLNAARPMERKLVDGVWKDVPVPLKQGTNVANFMDGVPVYDKNGNIIGRANASVVVVDPVNPDAFIKSADDKRARILAMARQSHLLISENATASGKSRKEARDEFRRSLQDIKAHIDAMGRYVIEFAMMYAANLTNRTNEFENLRCDFNAIVDAGDPSPEEKADNRAAYLNGEISMETLRSLNGADDPDAESSLVKSEPDHIINQLKKAFEVINMSNGLLTKEQQLKLMFPDKTDAEIAQLMTETETAPPVKTLLNV